MLADGEDVAVGIFEPSGFAAVEGGALCVKRQMWPEQTDCLFAGCTLWRIHGDLTERGHEVCFVAV